ncbi:hypothetical protein LguiA_024082 [Lonicera macranthoides]
MGSNCAPYRLLLLFFTGFCALCQCSAELHEDQTALLFVNASEASARKIPETLFGLFFEEINHAGAGGLWAELVSNRGFEAGGQNTPSNIDPWSILGNGSLLIVSTDRSSLFDRNKIALRMEVLCDREGTNVCPAGGVGIYNPGFWGMNIEKGKIYKAVMYIRSSGSTNLSVSLTDSTGLQILATTNIVDVDFANWTKVEVLLEAKDFNDNSRLQLTTSRKGVIWFDQVSLMPLDTYKGHGFRNDLFKMLADLKPGFIRFPGGCFVEGEWLRNAFRWKETIGAWEERPGHFGDVWMYWTDDGLGHFEFLQLAEDLGALPIWVFNNGISHQDEVETSSISPFLQEILDGIEFARGDSDSKWGSVRAAMGHPAPFDLRYVAIGNEDCGKKYYRGNYLKFYYAIKSAYPDIKMISNCDGSSKPLDHPADMYDFHIYSDANTVFSMSRTFDHTSRNGPKAFVSEYAVTGKDAGTGSLLSALAEAGFLIGLEKNSDTVEMASYAPLFVNVNDRRWNPDAIVFNSSHLYGTPSYWMQRFFTESNGATLLNSTLKSNSSISSLVASAITWHNSEDNKNYLRVKIVNFGSNPVNLKIYTDGLELNSKESNWSTKTVLTSSNTMDENSFKEPKKRGEKWSGFTSSRMTSLNTTWLPNSFQLRLAFHCRKSPVLLRMRVHKLDCQICLFPVAGESGKNGNRSQWRRIGNSSMNSNSSIDAFSGWSSATGTDGGEEQSTEPPRKRWPGGIVGAGVAGFVLVAGLAFAMLSMSKGTSRPKQQMEPLTTQEEMSFVSADQGDIVEEDGNEGKNATVGSFSLESKTGTNKDSSSYAETNEATIKNDLFRDIDVEYTSNGSDAIKKSSTQQEMEIESDVDDISITPLGTPKLPESEVSGNPFAASSFVDSDGSFDAEKKEASIEAKENPIDPGLTSSLVPDDYPTILSTDPQEVVPGSNGAEGSNFSLDSSSSFSTDTPEDPLDIKVLVIPELYAVVEPQIASKEHVETVNSLSSKEEYDSSSKMPEISSEGNKSSLEVDNLNGVGSSGTSVSSALVYPFAKTPSENDHNDINGSRSLFDSTSNGTFSSSAGIPAPSVVSPSLKARPGKVLVPAVIDQVQGQALAALQVLKNGFPPIHHINNADVEDFARTEVVEADVQPGDLCTRREYARWLVSGSSALSRSSVSKVYPAMYIENVTELAFDDITPEDPDFPSIQGLAEAGLISSKLSRRDMSSSLDEEESPLYFSPESPLSRQDLVSWKMSLEKRQLPITERKILQEVSGFIDIDRIHPDALPALVSDLSAGEQGIVALAFGYTRLFQPNKPVTKAQAAIALATGEASDIVSEELARIEAESMAEKAVAAHSAIVDLVEKDVNASFEEELSLEKEKINAVQKLAEETMKELETLRAKREEENISLMKERATVDSEMEVLSRLRIEVEEQLQSVMSNKIEISYEKERLSTLRRDAETENQEIARIKYELEVERKALCMARAWAEDEAKRAREQAKVLEEAREHWEGQGIKVVVDNDLREEADTESTWLNSVKQFSPEGSLSRAENLVEKLKEMAAVVQGKSRNTIEKAMEKIVLLIFVLKEWTLKVGKQAGELRNGAASKVGGSLEELQQSSAELSLAVKEAAKRVAGDCREGVEKLTHKFKT